MITMIKNRYCLNLLTNRYCLNLLTNRYCLNLLHKNDCLQNIYYVKYFSTRVSKVSKVSNDTKDTKDAKTIYNPETDLVFNKLIEGGGGGETKTIYNPETDLLKTKPVKIEINGIVFNKLKDEILIDFSSDIDHKKSYESIQLILQDIQKIDSKGFLNNTDLNRFPVISLFINHFTTKQEYIQGNKVSESYKWIYNVIMMNLYAFSIKILNEMEQSLDPDSDLNADFKASAQNIFGKIDPSLRSKLQKRGISIIQNTYTGFDTEYKNIDPKYNKLISVQLAVNTKTLLKVPKYSKYELSSLDTLNGREYKVNKVNKGKGFNYIMVENSLNKNINEIRNLKFKRNDASIFVLIEGLKRLNIPFIEKDDSFVFSFPRTPIQPFIYYDEGEGYSIEDMIKQANLLGDSYLIEDYNKLIELLKRISKNVELHFDWSEKENNILKQIESKSLPEDLEVKKMTRSFMSSFTDDKVSVTKIRNSYLIAHLTNADLSMMKDFELFKEELNIVNKSFVTLGKPLVIGNTNIIIRDTMLLAPQGNRSLESIGNLYGQEYRKINLSKEQKENMDLLLKTDKTLFDAYALKDAIITLIHSNYMEDFNFKLNEVGIPITLSSLGSKYVKNHWRKINYGGYQISPKYLLGDTSATQTPKGLLSTTETGLKLSYYIANYKGGRNESFMYGVDNDIIWFDYDLTSAYTTVMAGLGNPDYNKGHLLNVEALEQMSFNDILYSYIIIKASFKFDKTIKYPSIPCYIDETTTVYPLEGECVLTGAEYLLAKNQGCDLQIKEIYYIPFEKVKVKVKVKDGDKKVDKPEKVKVKDGDKDVDKPINHPFKDIIKEIQSMRRKYPKYSINNLLYKEMGNSIYGLVVRGMSDKKKFDIKSGRTLRMEASDLSNPILASWITGFIRSIIGECLHNISLLKGKVVSVTTDGFITNIEGLESKILDKNDSLIKEFKKLRFELSDDDSGLEIKNSGKGIISWTTRGQLGKESKIKATTGFQSRNYTLIELDTLFKDILKRDDKSLEYVQSSLRSAIDLYKEGGHVTMVYKDQIFRLQYDNRRIILLPKKYENTTDFSGILLDSNPVPNKEYSKNLRYLSKLHKQRLYNKHSSTLTGNKYKNYTDLAIRNFIKGLLSDPPKYKLDKYLNYSEIIDFIKAFDDKAKVSKQSISNLKNRKMILKPVPRTKETVEFVEYIKTKFRNFDENDFLAESQRVKPKADIKSPPLLDNQSPPLLDNQSPSLLIESPSLSIEKPTLSIESPSLSIEKPTSTFPVDIQSVSPKTNEKCANKVEVYDQDTGEKRVYDSIREAARVLKINSGTLSRRLNRNVKKSYRDRYVIKKLG